MAPIFRCLQAVSFPALLIALGCASTSTTTTVPETAKTPPPAEMAQDPGPVTIQGATATKIAPVYFDTDQALLRPEAREALKQYAKAILEHPDWGVLTIEGHCDERGSDEYNLALGKRRAAVVQRYLMDLGVPRTRLATRSFGEDQPAVAGHHEEAWRYNRRSELKSSKLESASR